MSSVLLLEVCDNTKWLATTPGGSFRSPFLLSVPVVSDGRVAGHVVAVDAFPVETSLRPGSLASLACPLCTTEADETEEAPTRTPSARTAAAGPGNLLWNWERLESRSSLVLLRLLLLRLLLLLLGSRLGPDRLAAATG